MSRRLTWKPLAVCSILAALTAVPLCGPRAPRRRPVADGRSSAALTGHRHAVRALAFAADGATLTTAAYSWGSSAGVEVTDWDVRTGSPAPRRAEPNHGDPCLAFARGGRTVAV